jgi:hypothetical protein
MTGLFDFERPAFQHPPALQPAVISQAQFAACAASPASGSGGV